MNLITKFTGPTKYDHHEFGCIWLNQVDDKESIFYIQASKDINFPNWIRLEEYFKRLLHNYFNKNIDKQEVLEMVSNILN